MNGRWTVEEFDTLLKNPHLDDAAVAQLLATRSLGAVAVVREGIHEFHLDRPGGASILSQMMREKLSMLRGHFRCARCGAVI